MSNLIVFYSRKGQNYHSGSICDLKKGNAHIIAEYIKKAVGGDMFEIETVKPYPADYYECTNVAQKELLQKVRPELLPCPDNLDKYDNIFVGFPNWWGTMPMAVFAFLEKYDLSGKNIIPFCTNAGSGLGNSEHDIKTVCVGAIVKNGLSVHDTEVSTCERSVADWAKMSI